MSKINLTYACFQNQTESKKLAYLSNFYMRLFWKVVSCFLVQSGGKPKIVLFKCYSESSEKHLIFYLLVQDRHLKGAFPLNRTCVDTAI